jgi:hypothetical protein
VREQASLVLSIPNFMPSRQVKTLHDYQQIFVKSESAKCCNDRIISKLKGADNEFTHYQPQNAEIYSIIRVIFEKSQIFAYGVGE